MREVIIRERESGETREMDNSKRWIIREGERMRNVVLIFNCLRI